MSRPKSALDLIGNTPLLCLDRIHRGPGRLLAKAEFTQPGGSVKDRAAKHIIETARASGALHPGRPVVEMTSGNMGAGLAVVCAIYGHPLIVTMSAGNSPQRAAMLRALGAEVVLVPQVDGTPGQVTGRDIEVAATVASRLAVERQGYYVDQFNNPGSVAAHEGSTGPEIWAQTDGRIDAFVASVGSGGTFVGVSRYLKRLSPRTLCIAAEPEGNEPLSGKPTTKPAHILQGTGYGIIPPQWDASLMDGTIAVSDGEAQAQKEALAHREGLHVGFSAAANVAAGKKLVESGRLPANAVVATILCDTGLKYG